MLSIRVKGLDRAIEVIRLQAKLSDERKEEFLKRLAEEFGESLKVHFYSNWSVLIGNGSPITIGVKPQRNGYAAYAQGKQVAFVEFGAGVFYNGSGDNYKLGRPPKLKGIGEFGKGKGKRNTWAYYDETGALTFTHGNPPANAFYYAQEDISRKIEAIIKEIYT